MNPFCLFFASVVPLWSFWLKLRTPLVDLVLVAPIVWDPGIYTQFLTSHMFLLFFMEVGITVAVAFLMENLAPPPTDPDLNFLFSSLRLKIPFNPQENLGYIAAHKFGPVLAI